jgi:transcriptional regulator with XRE-family HTH domain
MLSSFKKEFMKSKPEEVQKILSGNVKTQRNKLQISQERLAEAAGVSVQTINDIEGGRKWVSAKTITKLAAALEVECFQLLIPDFFHQNRKETSPTQNLMKLKERMQKSVDTLIDTQFTDFIKTGLAKQS